MNTMQVFDFKENPVRIIHENNDPWFHAGDVCSALGYGNPRQAVESHVDEDDVQKLDTIDALGRTQQVNFVNESGVYALIFGSTKPDAKAFKRWVTNEILPALRKDGHYILDSNPSPAIKQYMLFLRANKASGFPLAVAVENARQSMRDNGINIDKILPMPPVFYSDTVKANAEKDAGAREKIFSIIQSQGTVKQGVLYNRCRNMDKNEFQKHLDVLLVQNKIQQFVFEHSATKKRFNLYRMSGALN